MRLNKNILKKPKPWLKTLKTIKKSCAKKIKTFKI